MANVLAKAYDDAIEFLFLIDDPIPSAIPDAYYDQLSNLKRKESEKSTYIAFNQNIFYETLPPKLQSNLVNICLEKHLQLVEQIITDQESGYFSDPAIIRRIVTSLHYQTVEFGEHIIAKGGQSMGVIFIKEHGVTVLGIQESVRLLDYFEFSYFGEWEVIFDRPAERSYVAINRNMVSDLHT